MHTGTPSRGRRLRLRAALLVAVGLVVTAYGDDESAAATTEPAGSTECTAAATTEPAGATTESTAAATTEPAGGTESTAAATTEPAGGTESTAPSGPQELVGLFCVDAGICADGGVTAGSYFRMVMAEGTVADGPFIENGDSPCGDTTWNPLLPGADGGLRTGSYQPLPDPVFDATGNATAQAIVMPVRFFAVDFGVATNETDPQTGESTTPPTLTVSGGELSGDLSAFAAAWNNQQFNQGSPKPDGSLPGNTVAVTGTFDEGTNHYTLDWTSQITGGPFNNFTGVWHLEGTFEAG